MEFFNIKVNDILHNWEACMSCGSKKKRGDVSWSAPSPNVLKFNVDRMAKGKLGNVGGALVMTKVSSSACSLKA